MPPKAAPRAKVAKATTPKSLAERIAGLEVGRGEDKIQLEMRLAQFASKEDVNVMLTDQFGKHNAKLNEMLNDHVKKIHADVEETVIRGVSEGIKTYDKLAKENFLTKGDLAAAPAGASQSAQQKGFFDTVGDAIGKTIEKAMKEGKMPWDAGSGSDDWWKNTLEIYRKEADQRMRLEFRQLMKQRFGFALDLPGASGHVEIDEGAGQH